MFDFFRKKEKAEEQQETTSDVSACITYYVKLDGTPMVDIHMSDHNESTVRGMEKLLMGLMDADFFPDTLEMLRDGLAEIDQNELFIAIATKIALERVQKRLLEQRLLEEDSTKEGENPTEEPCFKPSDIL